MILQGDCIEKMKVMADNSIDAIITDPPYGLEFMGKKWDEFKQINTGGGVKGKMTGTGIKRNTVNYQAGLPMQIFFTEWAKECLRILKPGGFLLSFGGTRTYHRLACGIEDAGFEIRDCIMWLYGSGFPKSLNIGKQIDKMQGNEREVVGEAINSYPDSGRKDIHREGGGKIFDAEKGIGNNILTKGTSEWEGWGTALKPAHEPIVVARKPLSEKNVALNVLKWGTGGINIDASRIETTEPIQSQSGHKGQPFEQRDREVTPREYQTQGRFPANIILDEEAGQMLDEQSGETSKGHFPKDNTKGKSIFNTQNLRQEEKWLNDKGGASRFFYCAKASKSERNLGCEDIEPKHIRRDDGQPYGMNTNELRPNGSQRKEVKPKNNNHPTVKPIKLMEYLIKLVSKEGAVVLDPFLGSGTTGIACAKLNRGFIGIEKEEEYVKIAEARIKPFLAQQTLSLKTGVKE